MADTRIMLTCKHCGAGMCIGKGYDGSYYTVNKNMFHDLNAFYEVHEKGKCYDDADYSQDAKNHFVILEEGETLADVASKSEVDWHREAELNAQRIIELEAEKDALIKNYAECMKNYAREFFEDIYEDCFDQYGYIDYEALAELKKKYTGDSDES